MKMVFVTLVGNMVAVNETQRGAEDTLTEILRGEVETNYTEVREKGEVRKSIRIRTCYVTLNQ